MKTKKEKKKERELTFIWNLHSSQIELHLKNRQESEGLFYMGSSRLELTGKALQDIEQEASYEESSPSSQKNRCVLCCHASDYFSPHPLDRKESITIALVLERKTDLNAKAKYPHFFLLS